MEIWKTVDDWPYEVSSLGRVRRAGRACGTRPGKVLKPASVRGGYLRVTLQRDGTHKQFMVHRLVADAFCPTVKDSTLQVNHIDGDKTHNIAENLEWVTCGENHTHAYRTGLRSGNHGGLKGESNGNAKITPAQVQEIRRLRGTMPQRLIGARFGLGQSQVSAIQRGDSWI